MYLLMLQASRTTGTSGGIIGLVVGVIVVLVLIGAFVLGSRRKEKEPPPVLEPHSPERDSWSTPPSTPGQAPHGHVPGTHANSHGTRA